MDEIEKLETPRTDLNFPDGEFIDGKDLRKFTCQLERELSEAASALSAMARDAMANRNDAELLANHLEALLDRDIQYMDGGATLPFKDTHEAMNRIFGCRALASRVLAGIQPPAAQSKEG